MKNRTPMAFPNKTPNRTPDKTAVTIGLTGLAVTIALCLHAGASSQQSTPPQAAPPVAVAQSSPSPGAAPPGSSQRRVLDRYCVTCHNQKLKTAGLMLDEADVSNPGAGAEVWEKVVRKLRTGTMPPPSMPQPPMEDRRALLSWLETSLDQTAAARPNPGRTETLRRLNRTEYQNAIRDLLALDIDATCAPARR